MPSTPYSQIQVGGHRGNSPRFVALVDVVDAEAIGAHRWSMSSYGYVARNAWVGDKRRYVFMHRVVLGLDLSDPDVDHINGDPLDNRRANLRVCTSAQNHQNLHHCGPHRGTSWDARRNSWRARVNLAGKAHWLGYFTTRDEAAEAAAAFRRDHMPFSADAAQGRRATVTGYPTEGSTMPVDRDQYVRHLRRIGMTDREITDLIAEQDAERAARAAAWDWEPAGCEWCEGDGVERPF